jgi:hypothetical protein
MLMVIFGAGASYDSSADYTPTEIDSHRTPTGGIVLLRSCRPPLANQLFELRTSFATAAEKIPKCQLILNELRNRPSDMSVEQQLEKLREQALSYPEGQRQLVSVQFYLQRIVGECQSEWNRSINSHTTYRVLLGQLDRQLKGEPACLVTFNYDTLLEEAFLPLGEPFRSLDDYISKSDYKIIKPHGSINWARELIFPKEVDKFDQLQFANDLIAQADTLQADDNYRLIPDSDRLQSGQWVVSYMRISDKNFQAVLPAVAIPLEKKQDYVCPTSHMEVLKECMSKADKLLVIGWKGAEENFLQLLSTGLKRGNPKMVVSSGRASAEEIKSTLQRFGIDGEKWLLSEKGFTNEVRSGSIEAFIGK